MNCLSINLQGAGCGDKWVWVKSLCQKHKVNFLAIQESKMEVMDLVAIRSFWGNLSFSHAFSPSRGASGGIIVIWDPDYISKKRVIISGYFVAVEARWLRKNLEVMFSLVYAPQDAESKRILWDRLHHMINSFQGECVLMGDFNVVRDESERLGSQFNLVTARSFNQFIDQLDLIDISMGGPRFTWSHKGVLSLESWIDFWLVMVL